MAIYSLGMLGSILGLSLIVVIFSLLCQAQKGDAYLEQLGRGEGGCLEDLDDR
ncbi:MAG: hypothetical protein M1438_16475 [Deltaproteobacteria bacterium]|nr:hypothetical protein [Deltaproteobacteria bacterium]